MPFLGAYSPASHGRHLAIPVAFAAVPLTHAWQANPSDAPVNDLAVPVAHWVQALQPFPVEYAPAPQSLHCDSPCPLAKEPGWQTLHAFRPTSLVTVPALHKLHTLEPFVAT